MVMLTNRPAMTIAVALGRKATKQTECRGSGRVRVVQVNQKAFLGRVIKFISNLRTSFPFGHRMTLLDLALPCRRTAVH